MKLKELFVIEYGQRKYHSKGFVEDIVGEIPLVSSGASNNGFYGRFNIEPKYSNVISVASTGSVGWSFYHPYNCCIDDNCLVLKPIQEMSDGEMIFTTLLINKDRYRYMYGRQVTPARIGEIELPEIPSYAKNKNLEDVKYLANKLINKELFLNIENWRWFNLGDLFTFEKGERLTKPDRIYGVIPLITAGENDNGVSEYISLEDFKDRKKIFENGITVDMFFNVFYHDYTYFSDDNIHTLIPINFELNKYASLFLATILSKLKYKYAYGRQVRLMRLPFEKIKLPVDKEGDPDWQFMEDYIKSLPYSASI